MAPKIKDVRRRSQLALPFREGPSVRLNPDQRNGIADECGAPGAGKNTLLPGYLRDDELARRDGATRDIDRQWVVSAVSVSTHDRRSPPRKRSESGSLRRRNLPLSEPLER